METVYREKPDNDRELLKGLPRINLGALLMPPIWGPANGLWITILYYPIWVFVDNLIYAAYIERTAMSVAFASFTVITLLAVTIVFAWKSQRYALERALENGKTREWYIRRQRIWAVAMGVIAILFLAGATYYNLAIRPTVQG